MIPLYMLDTNMFSYIAKARSIAAQTRFRNEDAWQRIYISSITEAELLYGIQKAGLSSTHATAVLQLLGEVEVLPWGSDQASQYGLLRARQERLGKTLDSLDMLIAAHAMSVNTTLITADKAFSNVAGLQVENWATDL